MARGDFTIFNDFTHSLADGLIDLDNDTIKLALIDDTVTPAATDATPQWGAGSGVDYDGNEVSPIIGDYSAGGLTISGPETNLSGATTTFDDDDSNLSIAQNGSGFTNAHYGILYSDTATNKNAIGFLDLDGPVSQVDGNININWNASGILTITRT